MSIFHSVSAVHPPIFVNFNPPYRKPKQQQPFKKYSLLLYTHKCLCGGNLKTQTKQKNGKHVDRIVDQHFRKETSESQT